MTDKKLAAGAALGPFTLEQRIALGGMAEIWTAIETLERGERQVGLKILQPYFGKDDTFRIMFKDETRIALRLRHEHILEVYAAHEIDGFSFQSMELLEGLDVRRILQRLVRSEGWFPVPLALYVGRAIARALTYAHAKKSEAGKPMEIVHRDVSPHNVMVTTDGCVKVLDFGIARAAERVTRTKTGVVKGKISYMAPEQAMAARVTPQTDIFACGIVLWEMLSMRRLFGGHSDGEVLRRVVKAEVPPLIDKNPSVPERAAKLVHQMLSASPEARPDSMQVVDNELSKILAIHYEVEDACPEAIASWMGQFASTDTKTPLGVPALDPTAETSQTDVTDVEDTRSLTEGPTNPGDL